jgi:hypothetical protein
MRLALLLLVACASAPRGPTAIVRFDAPEEWSREDRAHIADGIEAWRDLGFEPLVEQESKLPRCPNLWAASGRVDCVIVIGLRREPDMMTRYQARGMADRVTDTVLVDVTLYGKELAHVIAHETGHILLNTARHVGYGVMDSVGWLRRLSAQDRQLACETVKRGCK